MDRTDLFEAQRPRLTRMATRLLGDHAEAEDVVQQAWLRLHRTDAAADGPGGEGIRDLPAWLTTATTRLCLDRLRARTPVPTDELPRPDLDHAVTADPADDVALADTVGVALQVVLDRLSPRERVAFVLHDTFGFAFTTVADVLDTTPVAARKLASRARAKVVAPERRDALADWEVVDAFMAAARGGDLGRLLRLLAPDAVVGADAAAVAAGTPQRIVGREAVAAFFDGSAQATLPVLLDGRPGSAWWHRGQARVVFDLEVADGLVRSVTFRAEPDVLARVVRRDGPSPVTPRPPRSSAPGDRPPTGGTT